MPDEAALREVGFVPVGTVTASIPSWPFSFRYPPALTRRRSMTGVGAYYPGSAPDDALSASRMGGFNHDYARGQTTGIVPDLGWSWQRVVHELRERQLFEAALDHIRQEAATLGAVGVIGLEMSWTNRPALSSREIPVFELRAVGLAVRTVGQSQLRPPFTTTLTGAATTLALRDGFVPVAAVFGVGRVRAELGNVTRRRLRSLGSGEVHQFSEALEKALQFARTDIERQARPVELVVGCHADVMFEREVGAGLEVTCRLVGTTVARFRTDAPLEALPILRLR